MAQKQNQGPTNEEQIAQREENNEAFERRMQEDEDQRRKDREEDLKAPQKFDSPQ